MQTDTLRWFQQVADGVTVTEVSEIERITQSGVSRALSRLEREVGTPLLHRSGRLLRMTRAGAAFKRHVDAMLHQLDDGLAAVNQLVDPETGVVAVAFQASLGTWLIPDLVRSFRADHPQIRFALEQIREDLDLSPLHEGSTDLVISGIRPYDRDLRWKPLLTEPLRVALAPGHPLGDRRELSLADLAEESFVALGTATALRRQVDELCQVAGFTPQVAFEADDLSTVLGFVGAGLGIAIVPAVRSSSTYAERGLIAYRVLTDSRAAREVGVAWSGERRLLPAADLFRRHVVDRAAAGRLPAIAAGA